MDGGNGGTLIKRDSKVVKYLLFVKFNNALRVCDTHVQDFTIERLFLFSYEFIHSSHVIVNNILLTLTVFPDKVQFHSQFRTTQKLTELLEAEREPDRPDLASIYDSCYYYKLYFC